MLRFESLRVSNFGPFKGTQQIDFGQENGVTIIWGNNGRGKTTLLNVFRYALFGIVKGRRGSYVDYIALSNMEEKELGKYGFSIRLKMSNDGDQYLLTRDVHLRDGITEPTCNEDFIEDFFLKKNGNILSSTERDHELNLIMPTDISRFFLFDGELLQEYEDLLDDNSDDGRKIKSSIEKILGMPILTNGLSDLLDLEGEYRTAKNKAAQNDKNTSDLANNINILMAQISGHKAEAERLEQLLAEETEKFETIRKKMSDTEKLRALLAEEKAIESQIESAKLQRDTVVEELKGKMKSAWQGVVYSSISTYIKSIEDAIADFAKKETTIRASRAVIIELQKTINECHCTICDQAVPTTAIDGLKERLARIQKDTPDLTEEEKEELHKLQMRLNALRSLNLSQPGEIIRSKQEEYNRLCIQISDQEQQLKDTRSQIKTYGDYDPATETLAQDYSLSRAKISEYKKGIESERKAANEAEDKRAKLDAKVNQLSSNKDVLSATRKLELCTRIREVFEQSVDLYRRQLKHSVERDASDLFTRMSADEDYEKLQINDNYGLEIIHKKGIKVPNRSAGFEHVVALSLIGALHKNAPLQGPVIMDSPFGRLDPIHKGKVSRNLPTLANQVILVVYEGEIEPAETRMLLGGHLLKEYHLNRVTSFYTRIE